MNKFLNYLSSRSNAGYQVFVLDHEGKTVSKGGDIVEYGEYGITLAVNHSHGQMLEAYPWNSVRSIVSTLQPEAVF